MRTIRFPSAVFGLLTGTVMSVASCFATLAGAQAQVDPTIYCKVAGTIEFKPPLLATAVQLTRAIPQRIRIDGDLSGCFGSTPDSDLYRTGTFKIRGRTRPLAGDLTETCSNLNGLARAGFNWRATLKSPDGQRLPVPARIHLVRFEYEEDGSVALILGGQITSTRGPLVNHGFSLYAEIEGDAASFDAACASPTGLSIIEIEAGPESDVRLD